MACWTQNPSFWHAVTERRKKYRRILLNTLVAAEVWRAEESVTNSCDAARPLRSSN